MEPAQAGEQGSSGLHWGGGQPSSPIAHGLSSLGFRVCQLGRVGGASGAPTGSSTWTVQSPEQRQPERIRKQGRRPQPLGGPHPRIALQRSAPHGAPQARGEGGRAAPYQADVERVVVILRHGHVHGQGHAVGKDGEQDDGLEGSAASVKE